MVDLQRIYEDFHAQGIPIFSYPAGSVGAATIELNGQYGVLADFFRFPSVSQQKLMLIHELGHCATGCTHKLHSPYQLVERHEFRANKYAALRYLPPEQFETAFDKGYHETWELAEWFGFPESFVDWALNYYLDNNMLQTPEQQGV